MTIPIHAIVFILLSLIWFIFFVPESESNGGFGVDLLPLARIVVWVIISLIYAGIFIW